MSDAIRSRVVVAAVAGITLLCMAAPSATRAAVDQSQAIAAARSAVTADSSYTQIYPSGPPIVDEGCAQRSDGSYECRLNVIASSPCALNGPPNPDLVCAQSIAQRTWTVTVVDSRASIVQVTSSLFSGRTRTPQGLDPINQASRRAVRKLRSFKRGTGKLRTQGCWGESSTRAHCLLYRNVAAQRWRNWLVTTDRNGTIVELRAQRVRAATPCSAPSGVSIPIGVC